VIKKEGKYLGFFLLSYEREKSEGKKFMVIFLLTLIKKSFIIITYIENYFILFLVQERAKPKKETKLTS